MVRLGVARCQTRMSRTTVEPAGILVRSDGKLNARSFQAARSPHIRRVDDRFVIRDQMRTRHTSVLPFSSVKSTNGMFTTIMCGGMAMDKSGRGALVAVDDLRLRPVGLRGVAVIGQLGPKNPRRASRP